MTPLHKTPDPGWMGDRSRGAGMGRASDNLSALQVLRRTYKTGTGAERGLRFHALRVLA